MAAVVPAAVTEKKKNRWSETEEKLLIEVYRENEQRLKYKAYSSPEWQEVAEELRSRCLKQQVSCEKTPKQCKDKLANLTKNTGPSRTNCDLLALVRVENQTKTLILMSRVIRKSLFRKTFMIWMKCSGEENQ